jgi:hypothetical protein
MKSAAGALTGGSLPNVDVTASTDYVINTTIAVTYAAIRIAKMVPIAAR